MTLIIRARFQKEGRSLSEVISNPGSFMQSGRLMAVLYIYSQMKVLEKETQTGKESPEAQPNNPAQEAKERARKDYEQNIGLLTRLDLKDELKLGEEALDKEAKNQLLRVHPDKDKNGEERTKDLNALRDLIKKGGLDSYLKELNKLRQG